MNEIGEPSNTGLFLLGIILFILFTIISIRGSLVERLTSKTYTSILELSLLNMWFYLPVCVLPLWLPPNFHFLSIVTLVLGPYFSIKYQKKLLNLGETPLVTSPFMDDLLIDGMGSETQVSGKIFAKKTSYVVDGETYIIKTGNGTYQELPVCAYDPDDLRALATRIESLRTNRNK